MSTFLLFVILGAGSGALYGLGSLGIVLVFRGSGVINFASGAIGMVGTFLFWELADQAGVPRGLALVAGVAASAALGFLTHLLLLPLRNASQLTRVVLTLSLLVGLSGIVGLRYPAGNSYTVGSLFPTSSVSILGARVGANLLLTIVAAVALTAVLGWFYRRTRFGLATSAVAENPAAVATLGWSPLKLAGANWALGGALAGLTGILLAPIGGLTVGLATSLLLPALAAAVLGNFQSFPLALAGGIAIGVVQGLLQGYMESTSVAASVPFFAILLVVILRGRSLPLRSYVGERLPRVTSGRISPVKLLITLAVVVPLILWVLPMSWIGAVTYTAIGAVLLLSIVVVTGFAGQISLAQWTIAGTGGLVCATLLEHGMPFVPAMVVGTLTGLPVGLVVGAAALRARGLSLAIATLALSVCLINLVLSNNAVNGGSGGLPVGYFAPFGFDLDATMFPIRYALFVVGVLVVVGLAVSNLRRGRAGRRMLAVRANERAAAALGVGVAGTKLAAFCIGAMIASLGGVLTILKFPTALFQQFDSLTSITLVSSGVFGGIGYSSGAAVGAAGTSGGVGAQLLDLISSNNVQYLTALMGVLTIVVIMTSPDGVVPAQLRQNAAIGRKVLGRRYRPARPKPVALAEGIPTHRGRRDVVLSVEGLSVTFGGVKALTDVSFALRGGEVLGVIGPNGAGKTTAIDTITGFTVPAAGSIRLNGDSVTAWSARRRSRLGIGRAFQSLELFEDMTVQENLLVACDDGAPSAWLRDMVWPGRPVLSAVATDAIRQFGLENVLTERPDELPYGKRRLLAIVRAIAADPDVLLLDEPAAGLDERERTELEGVIRSLADDWGMAVLLVEHDVRLVTAVSDHMIALDFGRVVASGTPDEVRNDPTVRRAYLGVDEAETAEPDGVSSPEEAVALTLGIEPTPALVKEGEA
ncbi:ATP-binding cassette domain-containing protein [Nocardioides sp. DS6]|uniref:ATP-binding cassette domain-containing protein n=1 Tax=Nocardioides eburneus TaxID=3231482 RepID=A0ABV3T0Q3_9ACTN